MTHADRLALAFETGQLSLPAEGRILFFRAEAAPVLDLLPRDRLECIQTFRPACDALEARGFEVRSRADVADGDVADGPEPAAFAIVNVTRSRAETQGLVAAALASLAPGAPLVVTGSKTDGVDSIARSVAAVLPLDGSYAKAHGRVFWLARPDVLPAAVAEWRDAAAPRRNAEGFLTAPGMFSPDASDPGSRRLAATFPGRLSGRVADLGAGWGWLAQAALAACPDITALDLHEAEALALDAARVNVPDPRARFHWSDVGALRPGVERLDWVITNPPFHQGRGADPGLGVAFIRAAARLLRPDGRLLMVANRQLPYEAPLRAAFRRCESLGEDGGYKLFLAAQPLRT